MTAITVAAALQKLPAD